MIFASDVEVCLVTQDDQQMPERGSERRISRDTLLLLGALSFLILAVALTFLFTPNTGTNIGQIAATATSVLPTEAAQSPVAPQATATPIPQVPYPSPEVVGAAPTATPLLPTGQPGTATATAGPGAPEEPYPGPVGESTPPPLPTFNPTVIQPTAPPPPTRPPEVIQPTVPPPVQPPPTAPPLPTPTADLALDVTPTAVPTVLPPTPTTPPPPPADVLRGSVRWSAAQGPIILRRDVQIAPGAELLIEPGVEVRLDPGVSIFVDGGRLLAAGTAEQPVRFVGNTGARWSGLFGRPGSIMVLEHTEVRGGGAGGTVMAV
ncbi:MAG: hypothetical protein SNJ69_07100, partial [Chloroflexaceae bacterium]